MQMLQEFVLLVLLSQFGSVSFNRVKHGKTNESEQAGVPQFFITRFHEVGDVSDVSRVKG